MRMSELTEMATVVLFLNMVTQAGQAQIEERGRGRL